MSSQILWLLKVSLFLFYLFHRFPKDASSKSKEVWRWHGGSTNPDQRERGGDGSNSKIRYKCLIGRVNPSEQECVLKRWDILISTNLLFLCDAKTKG